MRKKKALLLVSTMVLSGLPLAIAGIGAARHWPSKPVVVDDGIFRSAQETRGLKEKAKEARYFRDTQKPKDATAYADLEDLANHSTVVIIGTPRQNTPVLSGDGKSVSLDYVVRVEYVYKGNLRTGSFISVCLPGGKLKFDDGSIAEIMTPWFKKMQNNKTYALFLQSGPVNGSLTTTGEAQGVFEIPTTRDDRLVKVHSGIPGHSIRKYHGTDVKKFLGELRRVTGKALKS